MNSADSDLDTAYYFIQLRNLSEKYQQKIINEMLYDINVGQYGRVLLSSTFPEKVEMDTLYLTVNSTAKKITVQSAQMKLSKELNELEYKLIYQELRTKEEKYTNPYCTTKNYP